MHFHSSKFLPQSILHWDSQINDSSPIEFYLILFNNVLHGSRDFLGWEYFVWGQVGLGVVYGGSGAQLGDMVGTLSPTYCIILSKMLLGILTSSTLKQG